jgi:hypothetical protein
MDIKGNKQRKRATYENGKITPKVENTVDKKKGLRDKHVTP